MRNKFLCLLLFGMCFVSVFCVVVGWMLSCALVMWFVVVLQESILCERWNAWKKEMRGSEVQ